MKHTLDNLRYEVVSALINVEVIFIKPMSTLFVNGIKRFSILSGGYVFRISCMPFTLLYCMA